MIEITKYDSDTVGLTWNKGYLLTNGGTYDNQLSVNRYTSLLECTGKDYLTVLASIWSTVQPCCQFFSSNDVNSFLSAFPFDQVPTITDQIVEKVYLIPIPPGATYFRTTCHKDSVGNWFAYVTNDLYKVISKNQILYSYKTFRPKWFGGNPLNTASLCNQIDFGISASNALKIIHSQIFNVLPGSQIFIKKNPIYTYHDISLNILFLDDDYNLLMYSRIRSFTDEWPNSGYSIEVPEYASRIILQGRHKRTETIVNRANNTQTIETYYNEMNLEVRMNLLSYKNTALFPAPLPNTDNIRYQHLTMKVMNSFYNPGNYLSDSNINIKPDACAIHGILALPNSYSTDGSPTRLIIFTHGKGVRYHTTNDCFIYEDILPNYWLSEGYAIMDMDGNPSTTDHNDNHFYKPVSVCAYETAYNWIVNHYNIRTDGVFSAGRSMGGGMQFVLAKSSRIPIIASAPIVAAVNPLGHITDKIKNKERKVLLDAFGVPSSELQTVFPAEQDEESLSYYELSFAQRELILKNQWKIAPYSPGYCFSRPLTDTELCHFSFAKENWNNEDLNIREEALEYLEMFYQSVKNSIDVSVYRGIPFRLFTCVADETVWCERVKLMHRIFAHGGARVQIHVYPGNEQQQDSVRSEVDAHRCKELTTRESSYQRELRTGNQNIPKTDFEGHRFEVFMGNCQHNYVNSQGVTVDHAPNVYIETLSFWRSIENEGSKLYII